MQVGPYIAELDSDDHLVIRREDGKPCEPEWYELWRLKNMAFGTGALAVEIFPTADKLVDGQNQRHLWRVPAAILPCLKDGRRIGPVEGHA